MAGTKRRHSQGLSDTTVFVGVDHVKDRLDAYLIFDARYNLTIPTYLQDAFAKGHLPGARPAYMDTDLSAPHAGTPARHPLPPVDIFVQWCQSQGVSEEKPVLVYDDQCGAMGGCRLWWMLHELGVEVYVLDGGYQAYVAAGLPLAHGPTVAAATPSTAWPFGRAFVHQVCLDALSPNTVMTDARAASRYASTVRPFTVDTVPGHIPGAYNLPFTAHVRVVEDGTGRMELRTVGEIRAAVLSAIGRGTTAPTEKVDLSECVVSCGSGISACLNIAAAHHVGLGLPLLYCGSWSEYSGVHRTVIQQAIVEKYGVLLAVREVAPPGAAKASVSAHLITATPSVSQEALELASSFLCVGETAVAYLRDGPTTTITVRPRP